MTLVELADLSLSMTVLRLYISVLFQNLTEELNSNLHNDNDALESVLSHVGSMGLYQKLLFVAMMPFGIFFAFTYCVQMFIVATPQNHWCRIPALANLSMELR